MTDQQAALFRKLLNGELSPAEAQVVVTWLGQNQLDAGTEALIIQHLQSNLLPAEITPELQLALDARLPRIMAKAKTVSIFRRPLLRYAAAVTGLLLVGLSVFLSQKTSTPKNITAVKTLPTPPDIKPGQDGAILTLANGKTIVLDSLQNGVVATQNGSNISLTNGQLTYDKNAVSSVETEYNTITTPRGRQFQLTLSDGTKVWLNAGSSLRYPTVFNGHERKVDITGEAYFEVAKNARQPFKVIINNETEIKVLGTHFDINAYQNEASINTTLLEGSVQVTHNGENTLIKPGQQLQVSQLNSSSKSSLLNDVDVARIVAWKNGVFNFENATLGEVMRQLERWYDVEVVYERSIPKLEFYGKMGRDLTLSNVLRGLQISKVNFRVEGKKLIVLP